MMEPARAVLGAVDSILPSADSGWAYYVLCGAFFLLSGLACGYFIWKKGHMQMLDAESEVQRTAGDLDALKQDLRLEERELRADSESSEIDRVISSRMEKSPVPEVEAPSVEEIGERGES